MYYYLLLLLLLIFIIIYLDYHRTYTFYKWYDKLPSDHSALKSAKENLVHSHQLGHWATSQRESFFSWNVVGFLVTFCASTLQWPAVIAFAVTVFAVTGFCWSALFVGPLLLFYLWLLFWSVRREQMRNKQQNLSQRNKYEEQWSVLDDAVKCSRWCKGWECEWIFVI